MMNISTKYLESFQDEDFIRSVKKILGAYRVNNDVTLFKMDKVSSEAKLKLRRTISQNPTDLLILCTFNPKVLSFSSGARIFHAINLLDWKHSIQGLKYKLNLINTQNSDGGFPIYTDGRTVNLKLSDICCIKGSGNYCHFYVHGRKEHLVTIRIKEVREKLEKYDTFFDVNRSLIININRVAAIGKESIAFRSQPKYKLKLGYRSVKKVKDELLWNN